MQLLDAALGEGGWEPVPLFIAEAPPGGPPSVSLIREFARDASNALRGCKGLDGCFCPIHGGMRATEDADDAGDDAAEDPDGLFLAAVRDALPAGARLVGTLDLHCNLSRRTFASAETPVVTCGSLFQVTPDGEKGEAIPLADCAPSAGADSACAVRDPANRVWFAPEPGGRDPGGPDGAAYATLAFVVVDVGPDVTNVTNVTHRRSETAVAPVRVNAKPVVPTAPRRAFVDSAFDGVFPLAFLASDADGDAVAIEITSALPGTAPVLGTRLFARTASGESEEKSEWRAVEADGVTPGAGLLSGSTLHALTPGSSRIWFAPRGVGASDACCPARTCGGMQVAATCEPCFDDGDVESDGDSDIFAVKPENDCLCCPARHFYGPGGGYEMFRGRDASRCLARMSLEECDLDGPVDDLNFGERDQLNDWCAPCFPCLFARRAALPGT